MARPPSREPPPDAGVPGRVAHFEVLSEIGRGGMGVVYRASDLRLGRDVALKCPWPDLATDPEFCRRFLHEARAASALSHPHIVPVFEAFEDNGVPWLAMELVEGGDLRARLGTGVPLKLEEILRHAAGLADALRAAHQKRLLHRDINPRNVLISGDGRARLTDFGLARRYVPPEAASSASTASTGDGAGGSVAGTPGYMSPEQALGQPVDPRSDIFSFGALLYEMCTGRPAFAPNGEGDRIHSVLHKEPTAIARLNYEIPGELERIVRKCLAKDPAERYQAAPDLLADIQALARRHEFESYSSGHPGERVPDGGRPPATPLPSRRWAAVALVGAAALAVALIALAIRPRPDEGPSRSREARRIAVLPPRILLPPEGADDWPEIFQALMVSELTGVPGLGVVDPLSLNHLVQSTLGSFRGERDPDLERLLRQARARWVVDGSIVPAAAGFELRVTLTDIAAGVTKSSHRASGRAVEDLPAAAATIAAGILEVLQGESGPHADENLRPWIGLRRQDVRAVRAFLQAGRYLYRRDPVARTYLERALDLDPSFVAPRVWLVSLLSAQGEIEAARSHHGTLLELEPGASPFDQAMIGWAGARLDGDLAAQIRHLEVALGYSPGNNIILVSLAEARVLQGDCNGAVEAMEGPVRERWEYPLIYPLWGWCNVMIGRADAAEAGLTASLDLGDVDPRVYGVLEAIAISRGDGPQARKWAGLLAERIQQTGDEVGPADLAPVYLKLAERCRAEGRGDAAAELLRLASGGDAPR